MIWFGIFRLDLLVSLYFSLLFRKLLLETGSNPTASSASQSGLHELTYGYRSNVAVPRRFADMARMKFMPLPARIPSQLWLILATLIGNMFLLSDLAPKPTKAANHADAADLGATARQALSRYFSKSGPNRD